MGVSRLAPGQSANLPHCFSAGLKIITCAMDVGGVVVLKIHVEKWNEDVLAKIGRGIAIPLERSQVPAVAVDLAVVPGPDDQMIVGFMPGGLERFPDVDRAVDVLLVPQALQPDGRARRRVSGDQLVERLLLPEGVVGGMGGEALPPGQLVEAVRFAPGARRAGIEVILVVVISPARDSWPCRSCWSGQ